MTDWMKYLSDDEMRDIHKAAIDAGLSTNAMLDALSQGLHSQYRGTLPGVGLPPHGRLYSELHAMNQVHNLRNGDVPLAQWLSAAIDLAGNKPQVDKLEEALAKVNGEVEVPPADSTPLQSPPTLNETFEAMIAGSDDTLSVNFLQRGVKAAASVVKLLVHRHIDGQPEFTSGDQPRLSNATGWIIGSDLLITNYHVINARMRAFGEADAIPQDFKLQAEHTRILYDYLEVDSPSATVDTEHGALVASDARLDFAILRIPNGAPQRPPLRLRKRHIRKTMEQALGTRVNVLQHPNGDPMRLGFRDNFVVIGNENSLSYLTDTSSGSSGSPVCDDSWHVAALHSGSRSIGDLNIEIHGKKIKRENFGTPMPRLMEKLKADHPELHDEIVADQT